MNSYEKLKPASPSFTFGYWRPWKEDSKIFNSYLDYARDTSLAKYGAETVGNYIIQASNKQVQAINKLDQAMGRNMYKLSSQMSDMNNTIDRGMNVLSKQMSEIDGSLGFLNRNMDIQIEQQKLSNLLLQNISELLRVPDSEKERQHSIELGIKFFVNASKNADLYEDALEELLKAESLMKQDYFVLHRIGCIYLHVEKYIDPEKAFDYFVRAAKYASIESDSSAVRLATILFDNLNIVSSNINNSTDNIGLLAAESYNNAAFSAYILGRFDDSVKYQSTAFKFNQSNQNRFLLAKYLFRNGLVNEALDNLDKCITEDPIYAIAAFKEIDIINEPTVIALIDLKNNEIDNKIKQLAEIWKNIESTHTAEIINILQFLPEKSYEIKFSDYLKYEEKGKMINSKLINIRKRVDESMNALEKTINNTQEKDNIERLIRECLLVKTLPYEKIQIEFDKLIKEISRSKNNSTKLNEIKRQIDRLINELKTSIFLTFDENKIKAIILELEQSQNGTFEIMQSVLNKFENEISKDKLKIGSEYAGGIVFFLDNTERHGLVFTKNSIGKAIWGEPNGVSLKTQENGKENTKLILKLAVPKNSSSWFSKNEKKQTAAELCLQCRIGGFSDWYLPSWRELNNILGEINKSEISSLKSLKYWSSNQCPVIAGNAYAGATWHTSYDTTPAYHKFEVLAIRSF